MSAQTRAPHIPVPVDVVLRDGSTVRVRGVDPGDETRLRELLAGLSDQSRWWRFFSVGVDLDGAARHAATVEELGGRGLVAITGRDGRIVGHAEYVPASPDEAEVAFEVADDWQGRGVATLLLAHLAQAATAAGIETFTASVLVSNHRMARVFRESGFAVAIRPAHDVLELRMPASLDDAARTRFEDRERSAAAAAVAHVLRPASIAVIGASDRPGSIGGAVLRNLLAGGYSGILHAVHPGASVVAGVRAYEAIGEVPEHVELSIVAVPASAVAEVARQCGAAAVSALVVLSAGFAECGAEGIARQAELLDVCRRFGMRLVGPNCLGVLNSASDVRMNATFAPEAPLPGLLAFGSQSGAYGIAGMAEARRRGIGLSSFVSMGDKADLSGNDLLGYWQDDPATAAVLLYLESFGNPRRFGRIAREVARQKPVIAVKSGRSAAGSRAAASHTGALLAASDATVDALFHHAGVIRCDTLSEMLDVAALVSTAPLPAGRRVAVITNAGGPGIACADACSAAGLEVGPPAERTVRRLRRFLPLTAGLGNPIDLIASATPDHFARAVRILAEEGEADAIVVIVIPTLITRPGDVAAALTEPAGAARAVGIPVVSVIMAEDDAALAAHAEAAGIPALPAPEEAARALGRLIRYAEWRRRAEEIPEPPAGVEPEAAAAVLAAALAEGGGWLGPAEVARLLQAYGIPLVESRTAATPTAVGRCAEQMGGAVAVKALAPGLVHKSDAGAIRLGVRGAAPGRAAARAAAAAVRTAGFELEGFLVQRMADEGVEMIVGVVGDPDFGPVVACGAGGRAVELLGDVCVRLAPLGHTGARDMLRELRTYPLLVGYRGAPLTDTDALEDVIVRVSALAAAHPEVAELDCNPVLAGPEGALVLDARVRVEPVPPTRPFPSLDR
jgi:acetyl coenzyme A synthetase (ADP forming)-like protein